MISGVYKILNTINSKIYIGSAVNIHKRQQEHINLLKRNNHPNNYLQNAWNKYGPDSFVFELLEITESNKDTIVKKEQYYLDTLQPFGNYGYNICTIAYSCLGIKRSYETKCRLSIAKLGNKNPMYKKTHSKETKQKLSDSKSDYKHWSYGLSTSNETIEKIRMSCSNKNITNDTKQKLSNASKQAWSNRKSKSQQVSINGEIYISIRAAARALNVAKDTITHRCNKNNYPDYKYLTN